MPVSLEMSPLMLCFDGAAIFAQNGMDWKHFRAHPPPIVSPCMYYYSNCTLAAKVSNLHKVNNVWVRTSMML